MNWNWKVAIDEFGFPAVGCAPAWDVEYPLGYPREYIAREYPLTSYGLAVSAFASDGMLRLLPHSVVEWETTPMQHRRLLGLAYGSGGRVVEASARSGVYVYEENGAYGENPAKPLIRDVAGSLDVEIDELTRGLMVSVDGDGNRAIDSAVFVPLTNGRGLQGVLDLADRLMAYGHRAFGVYQASVIEMAVLELCSN